MQLALFPAPATFEQLSLELFTNQPTTERPNTTMHTTTSPTTTAPSTTTTAPEETTTTTAPPATTTPAETTTTSSTVLVAVTDPPVPTTSIVQPPRFPAPTALPETGPSSITPWALLIGAAAIAAGLLTLRRARR